MDRVEYEKGCRFSDVVVVCDVCGGVCCVVGVFVGFDSLLFNCVAFFDVDIG
jgi:hypothetical protein